MSSILRALKKLENEPRHLEKSRSLENKFVPLADTEPQRPVSSIFMMVAGAGIVCGLVILAGWWLFSPPPAAVTQKVFLPGSSRLDESPTPPEDLNRAQAEAVAEQTPEESIPAQETPGLETDERTSSPVEKPVVPAFSTQPPPRAKTVRVEIPRLNDPTMNLQAVTWSRTPQKRIAVINNRILREGDMVSGYLISTINQDDVVLSQEGTKWKLLFH